MRLACFINRSSGLSQRSTMTAFVKWARLFGLIIKDVFTLKICINRGESNSFFVSRVVVMLNSNSMHF